MTNGTDPDKMTPAERMDELASLLSEAILRLWSKRQKRRGISREFFKNPLGNTAESQPHVDVG